MDYRTIGKNACIEKIGREFVSSHRDDACFTSQDLEDNESVFCFLGIDLHPNQRKLCLSNENDWDVYATCYVRNGIVEMSDCLLP